MVPRVIITDAAKAIVDQLKQRFGDLMFHQSGGCCDGSQPMCFEKGDFKVGNSDVLIGVIEDSEFWISRDQFEYWQYTQLCIDVIQGRGSSFSIEIPMGVRFITQSRLYTDEELENLEPVRFLED